jgi:hypothetical protein
VDANSSELRSRAFPFAALALIVFLNGFAMRRWVKLDERPLEWDQAIHMTASLEYRDRVHEGRWKDLLDPALFNYPPLYHWCVAAAVGATKDLADTGAFVNFFFLIALIIAVYLIAEDLVGPWPAVLAAALVTSYPVIVDNARQTMIDVALTSAVAVAVLCVLRSDDFRSPGWSVGFALALAAGMLMKWSAFVYVAGPFLWVAVRALRARRVKWLAISLALSAALIIPWYAINLIPMAARLENVTTQRPAGGIVLEGIMKALWYPLELPQQMALPLVLLLLPGLVVGFSRPKLRPVLLWFVVSLVLFTLIHNRNIRYSMPALPAAAILSVAWLPKFRGVSLWVAAGLCAGIFWLTQACVVVPPNLHAGGLEIPIVSVVPPRPGNWQHNAIIDRVLECKPPRRFVLVVTLANHAAFHGGTLNVSASVKGVRDVVFVGPSKKRWLEFAEFILMKTGDAGPAESLGTINPCLEFMKHPPAWFADSYVEAGRWPLPDGSDAILYHLEPRGRKPLDAGILNVSLDEFRVPNIVAKHFALEATPISAAETAKGRLKSVKLSCASLEYKGLAVNDVSIHLEKPAIQLPLYLENGELILAGLESLAPNVTLNADTILAYAREKLPWLADPSVSFDGSVIHLSGRAKGMKIQIAASLTLEKDFLRTRLESVRVAGFPIPLFFVRAVTDRAIPLSPNREMPFTLKLRAIQGEGQKLRINS